MQLRQGAAEVHEHLQSKAGTDSGRLFRITATGARTIPEQEVQTNHPRYIALIEKFWKGSRLSLAEMAELTRLHTWNIARVWEIDTAKEEVEA